MNALALSQTIFYAVVSLVALGFGVLLGIILYHMLFIIRDLRIIARDLQKNSRKAQEGIIEILERLENSSFFSLIFGSRTSKK